MNRTLPLIAALLVASVLVGCRPSAPAGPPVTRVEFTSTPPGAEVYLNGNLAGSTPLTREVVAGPHMVEFRLPGHETLWRPFTATGTQPVTLAVTLAPMTTILFVDSQPPGAFVKLDGSDHGTTPVTLLGISAGPHELVVAAAGVSENRQRFEVTDARPQRFFVTLESVLGHASVTSQPGGAEVLLNNKRYGTTPDDGKPLVIRDLTAGEYQVTVRKPGYRELARALLVKRDETVAIAFPALAELPGGLEVTTDPPGARILSPAGELLGTTPTTLEDLPNGDFRFRVTKDGYAPEERTVVISRALVKQVALTLTPTTGGIQLATEPPGVVIFLDGKQVGTSEPADNPLVSKILNLPGLDPGPRRLDLSLAEHESVQLTVIVEKGKTTQLGSIKLKRRWLPTHELKVISGTTYRGVLIAKKPDGSVVFERAQNIQVTYRADEIALLRPLR